MNSNLSSRPFRTTNRRRFTAIVLVGWMAAAAFPVPADQTTPPDFSSFQIISQRNIFNPNRTGRSRSGSRRANQPAADSFALAGIMSYEKGAFAFFDGKSPDYRKVLKPDGGIAGFKLAAIRPDSVTLSTSTNETVLKVGAQMRRDDTGRWEVLTEPALDSDARADGSGREVSARRRADDSTQTNASMTTPAAGEDEEIGDSNGDISEEMTDMETETNAPPAAAQSGGGANDVLTRLMQRRAQEAEQLRQ